MATYVAHSLADVDIRLRYFIALMSENLRRRNMRNGDVALRFSIVFALAGFITMAAGVYEIDRREKSSSETVTRNLTEIEQRVRMLSEQIRILNDQFTRQLNASERQVQALGNEVQALASRLKELEDHNLSTAPR